MFQRANAPHYSQPHKAYENKNPREPPPPAKPVSRQKDYDNNENTEIKKAHPKAVRANATHTSTTR